MNVWLSEIWQAWRASLRKPGFLLLASGVLALGIGSTVAVFTLVDHVLLRPLPFPQPDRIVAMGMDLGGGQPVASPRQYQHLKHLHGVLSTGLVTQSSQVVNILDNGTPQQARALTADRDLLPTLGVHALIGHNFTTREDLPHGPPVVMLGHGFWERAYGGKSDVLGRQLLVKGVPHTIVGVLPARFDAFCDQFAHGCDIMLPLALAPGTTDGSGMYLAVARMAPGTTLDAVRAQVDARMQRLVAASKDSDMQDMRFKAMGLHAALHAGRESTLVLFMGAALFVLLIACINLANLLCLRALSRGHDAAIRTALGASSLRRKLPVLAESLLVGVIGALVGVGLAASGLALFRRFMPAAWLGGGGLHVSMAAWAFACVVAVCAALAMTWLALWRMRRLDFNAQLREGGRSGAGMQVGYASRVLVIAQVALATALLAGAGLFVHALIRASQVRLGFNPTGVATFDMRPLKTAYPDVQSVSALATRVRRRFDAEPGVLRTSVSTSLPTGGYTQTCGFHVGSSPTFCTKLAGVDLAYFATIGVPIVSGRTFNPIDLPGGERVAIVNQAFARKYFGGHALGKTLDVDHPQPSSLRIVGVVGNTRHDGPLSPAPPILFLPLQQVSAGWLLGRLTVALHVRGDPAAYRKLVHDVMTQVAPMQPIADFQPLTRMVAHKTLDVRMILLLLGVFAVLALLLATAGIYAVMAVAVASREHEFGVRTALGASPSRLMRLVLRGGLVQVVIGLIIGVGIAVLLSGVMRTVLARIGHDALDPLVMACVCLLLIASGLLACLIPALRAGRVQPMQALRGE